MSSLLSNDFVEEYRRIENPLRTNNERFSYNNDNKVLRLSTPLLEIDDLSREFENFIGQNKTPENVNLLLDNITIISTNPNFQNYLPLKIQLDEKIRPEFASTNQYTLTDYRIISKPTLNLPRVSNYRWTSVVTKPYLETSTLGPLVPVASIYDVAMSDVESGYYYNLATLTNNDRVLLVYKIGATGVNPLTYLVPTTIASTNSPNWILFGDRRENVFLLSSSENPVEMVSFIGDGVTGVNREQLILTAPNERFIGFLVPDFGTMVLWTDNSTTKEIVARFYGKGNIDEPWSLFFRVTFTRVDKNFPLKVYRYGTDVYFILYRNTDTGNHFIESIDFSNNSIGDKQFFTDIGDLDGQNPKNFYIAGSLQADPLVTILTDEGRHYYLRKGGRVRFIDYGFSFSQYPIKRYQNQGYLVKDGIFYAFNLDDPTYRFNINLNNAYQIVGTNITAVYITNGFNRKRFIIVGKSQNQTTILQGNLGGTTDKLKSEVYKSVYNYDSREYPYYLNNNFNFNITLPNNDNVKTMEIFKFIFDFRVRYTNNSIGKPKAVPVSDTDPQTQIPTDELEICLEECMTCVGDKCDPDVRNTDEKCPGGDCSNVRKTDEKRPDVRSTDAKHLSDSRQEKCFALCNRSVGSVNRILGYVGDEFNVEDFLNIYSTR